MAVARGLLDVGGAPPPPARRGALVAGLRVLRRLAPDEPLPRAVVAALLEASCSYAGSGDVETATALAEVTPDDYEVQRLVGLLADRQRGVEGKRLCLPALRRAVDLAPAKDQVELGVRLCALLSTTGAREECVAACDRFLPLVADDAEARSVILVARGRVRRALGQIGPALADLDEAVALAPVDFKATHERALARLAAGDPTGALADASQTLRLLPDAGSIESDRMVCLLWDQGRPRGETAPVRAAVERLVSGRPMYSGWWVRLALLQVEADEPDPARASLERAASWFAEEEAPWLRGLAPEVAALAEALGAGAAGARERLADLVRRLDERRAGGARP
ncbi:MAG: hypothetical protein KF878_03125 [Planctomycetes bacterium]|nr:hypothetical protein [Planctomycetota bacterium]